MLPLVLLISQLPIYLVFRYVYFKNRQNDCSNRDLIICFIGGMLSCFPAAYIENIFGHPANFSQSGILGVLYFVCAIGLVEEGGKFLVVRYFAYPKKYFNQPFDGVLYGVTAALGFASLENFLYVGNMGLGVGFMRMITAIPMHAAGGMLSGYYLGLAKFLPNPSRYYQYRGLAIAAFAHGIYDYGALTNDSTIVIVCLVILVVAAKRAVGVHFGDVGESPLKLEQINEIELFGKSVHLQTLPISILYWLLLPITVLLIFVALFSNTAAIAPLILIGPLTYSLLKLRAGLINDNYWSRKIASFFYIFLMLTPAWLLGVLGLLGIYASRKHNNS